MDVFDLYAALKLDKTEYDSGLNEAKGSASSFGSMVSSALGTAAKAGLAAITAASTGVIALTKKAVESYASYEQLVGGVETLFGAQGQSLEEYAASTGKSVDAVKDKYETLMEAQATALDNASKAYKTAGMSANEYMETITSFAASLKQSTKDEVEAAQMADLAVKDMADNSSKMGTSMESIQMAYQGFAKQNYTMLDNLKLGYGGTKTEMERLLADAQKLTGVKYNINNLSDVYNAIHAIQENLGITGTTAKEAMYTIEGSANMTKSAWENVITAMGRGEGLSEAFDNLVTAIFGGKSGGGILNNIIPRIQTIMEGIGDFIVTAAPLISDKLPELVEAVVPSMLNAAGSLIAALVSSLPSLLEAVWNSVMSAMGSLYEIILGQGPNLLTTAREFLGNFGTAVQKKLPVILQNGVDMVSSLMSGIGKNTPPFVAQIGNLVGQFLSTIGVALPQILSAGFDMIANLVVGILNNLPSVVSAIGNILDKFLSYIVSNLPTIMKKGVDMVGKIAQGILNNLPAVLSAVARVLSKLLATIASNMPKLLQKGIELIGKVAAGIIRAIPKAVATIPKVISGIVRAFASYNWGSIGSNIISGIRNGLSGAAGAIVSAARSAARRALDAAKNFLGIHSPSRVFRDQVGKMMALGMGVGVEENAPIDEVSGVVERIVDKARSAVKNISVPITTDVKSEVDPNGIVVGIGSTGKHDGTAIVTAINDLMDYEFSRLMTLLTQYFPQFASAQVVLDTGATVGQMAPAMNVALGKLTAARGRGR